MTHVAVNKNISRGFVALTSILIISAVALSVTVSIALLGITEARNSLDFKEGIEAFKLAEACGEEGMLRSRNDDTYTGGTLNFTEGNCTIAITDTGTGYQLDITATSVGPPDFVKSIQIQSEVDGNGVTVVTWSEVE